MNNLLRCIMLHDFILSENKNIAGCIEIVVQENNNLLVFSAF